MLIEHKNHRVQQNIQQLKNYFDVKLFLCSIILSPAEVHIHIYGGALLPVLPNLIFQELTNGNTIDTKKLWEITELGIKESLFLTNVYFLS